MRYVAVIAMLFLLQGCAGYTWMNVEQWRDTNKRLADTNILLTTCQAELQECSESYEMSLLALEGAASILDMQEGWHIATLDVLREQMMLLSMDKTTCELELKEMKSGI